MVRHLRIGSRLGGIQANSSRLSCVLPVHHAANVDRFGIDTSIWKFFFLYNNIPPLFFLYSFLSTFFFSKNESYQNESILIAVSLFQNNLRWLEFNSQMGRLS